MTGDRAIATHAALSQFGLAVLAFYALLWGAQLLLPGSAAAGAVLVSAALGGAALTRPGWNLQPTRIGRYVLALLVLLLASAAAAAAFLRLLEIANPYGASSRNLLGVLPAIVLLTGMEELLFRQVMFRWLERRAVPPRTIVAATAAGFGLAHLGAMFGPLAVGWAFHLSQSLYLIWIGLLLGELRRTSGSWLVSWIAHAGYNAAVLVFLAVQLA